MPTYDQNFEYEGATDQHLYAIYRKNDGTVFNATDSTVDSWTNGDIGDYDVPLTFLNGDLYGLNHPEDLPNGFWFLTLYRRAGGSPATTDPDIGAGDINWNGTNVVNPAAAGPTYLSVSQARDLLQNTARAAGGLADDNTGKFDAVDFDTALQLMMTDFVDKTRCTRQTDTILTVVDDTGLDFSGITGFQPDYLIGPKLWIDDKAEIDIVGVNEIIQARRCGTRSGAPTKVAFNGFTSALSLETIDDAYTVNVVWSPDPTYWTPGDTGADDDAINIPAGLLRPAIMTGGVYALLNGLLAEGATTDKRWNLYLDHRNRSMGKGGFGVHSSQRPSIDSMRWR